MQFVNGPILSHTSDQGDSSETGRVKTGPVQREETGYYYFKCLLQPSDSWTIQWRKSCAQPVPAEEAALDTNTQEPGLSSASTSALQAQELQTENGVIEWGNQQLRDHTFLWPELCKQAK